MIFCTLCWSCERRVASGDNFEGGSPLLQRECWDAGFGVSLRQRDVLSASTG